MNHSWERTADCVENMNPTVSVIIPNYNHARFLEERIQSVLNQTYQDFELILLDDCSPDGGASREVIERYRSNPHVSHIVYNDVNSGSAFSQWFKGIELAKGEYIWIAESDDSCDNTLLETLMSQIVRNQAVMAFCKSLEYDEKGRKSRYDVQSALDCDFVLEGTNFIKEHLIVSNIVANASSVVFRRDVAMSVDTQYAQMKAIGDWLFWIMLAERGEVCFVNEELNYFRQHSQNITKKNAITGTCAREEIILFNYLVSSGLLKGRRKQSVWLSRTHRFTTLHYDEETMSVLMHDWDKYHIYRMLYPIVRAKAKLVSLFRLKTNQ